MKSCIKISERLRVELIIRYRVTSRTVLNALCYITNSKKANAIREYALSHGGVYTEEQFVPNCRTSHEGDMMIQRFPRRVTVRINKTTGDAEISRDGEVIERYTDITLKGWSNLLAKAEAISDEAIRANGRSYGPRIRDRYVS